MQKKLTITIDEQVYEGLHAVIGRRRISRFIEDLVRPYVLYQELEPAYRQMAQDEERKAEALEWCQGSGRFPRSVVGYVSPPFSADVLSRCTSFFPASSLLWR